MTTEHIAHAQEDTQAAFAAPPTRRTVLRAGLGLAAGLAGAGALAPALTFAGGSPAAVDESAAAIGGFPAVVGANTGQADPQMAAVLAQLAAFHAPPLPSVTPEVARQLPTVADAVQAVQAVQAARGVAPAVEPVGRIDHILIPGLGGQILVRVYTPRGTGPFPVLVYFHGGGFVIANLDTYDSSARALTNAANCVVMSVAYRQAPEHKFPAAPQDAYAALRWAQAHAATIGGDPRRVAVGGESAGGNLATVVCLMARDRGTPQPVHQLLVYPLVSNSIKLPSYQQEATAKPLDTPSVLWFEGYYLRTPADALNPYVAPLQQARSLRGLAPATVITDQFDPLRSEGEAYARRLRAEGVPVSATRYNGVTHEFFTTSAVVDKAKQAVAEAASGLRSSFR